ncbi:tyrosine-protein phosphatase [Rhodococcus sp. NPDC003318]|uniref:tyrosine-protein phosphatase n=1 Tax=Rhodococcus sp. NPDC003318 TaxID=3364503 RepID=UPI0036D1C476
MKSSFATVGVVAAMALALAGCGQSTTDDTVATSSVAATQAVASVAAPTPRLSSVNNFRDLAGPDGGYVTSDGHRVRAGVVYRANALTPSDADATTLDSLDIAAVYDLRTAAEIGKAPDRVPAGARYTNVDITGAASNGAVASTVDLSTPQSAAAVLVGANRQFVSNPAMRAEFATLLGDIASTDGPQIIHCTAGKDRTGWASAVLLKIAGVDDATVMSNYLLTNEYSKESIEATATKTAAAQGEQAGEAMRVLMGVSPEFLQAGLDEVTTSFGTFDNYLTNGLGLSAETIATLKAKLTV